MRDINALKESMEERNFYNFLTVIGYGFDYRTLWYEAISCLIPIPHVKWLWDTNDAFTIDRQSITIITDDEDYNMGYTMRHSYYDYSSQKSFDCSELNSEGLYIRRFMSLSKLFEYTEGKDFDLLLRSLNDITNKVDNSSVFVRKTVIKQGVKKTGNIILRRRASLISRSLKNFE